MGPSGVPPRFLGWRPLTKNLIFSREVITSFFSMHSRSYVVTKERMKSLQEKKEYDLVGHTNKNGMQREVSKGIQISKHGAKSQRFILNLEDENDDQSKSQPTPKKVKFVVNPPGKVKLSKNTEESKKDEIPTPGFKKVDPPLPNRKFEIPEDKVVHKHHLRLPTISRDKKAEMKAKGITVKKHMQSWLADNEFFEGIPEDELYQIATMLLGEELFAYDLEHSFVDDLNENGDIVIWSEFYVDVLKDENARLLSGNYEKDLPAMKKKYSKPKELDEDLVSILKYVKTEEFRRKQNYIRLVFSQNEENQASLSKQVEKDKQKFIEERLRKMNETIQPDPVKPTIIKKKKRKVVSRKQLEKMNKVIESDQPKKKVTSRSQIPRAKPDQPSSTSRIRLRVKNRKDKHLENDELARTDLIVELKKIYKDKTEEEIKEIANQRIQTFKDKGYEWTILPFPLNFLNHEESEIHTKIREEESKKNLAFNRLAAAFGYAHPDLMYDEIEKATRERLKDFLDNYREITDIQLEEFLDEQEFAAYKEEEQRIKEEKEKLKKERERVEREVSEPITAAIDKILQTQTAKEPIQQQSNQLAEFNDFWLDKSNDNSSFESFSDSDSDVVEKLPSDTPSDN